MRKSFLQLKGFSLLEVIVVVGIFAIFIGTSTYIITTAQRVNIEASEREIAHRIVADGLIEVKHYIEQIRSSPNSKWYGGLGPVDISTSGPVSSQAIYFDSEKIWKLATAADDSLRIKQLSSPKTLTIKNKSLTIGGGFYKEYQSASGEGSTTIFRKYTTIYSLLDSDLNCRECVSGDGGGKIDASIKCLATLKNVSENKYSHMCEELVKAPQEPIAILVRVIVSWQETDGRLENFEYGEMVFTKNKSISEE